MLIVEGKYVFDLEVGNFKDFLEPRDLVEFTLIEEGGNVLPHFDLKFRFSISELRNYLIENNVIRATIGSSDEDKISIPLRIFKKDLQNYGQGRYYISISGTYDALGYMRGTHTESISEGGQGLSGTEAIKKVVSKFFNFETNVSSEDSSIQKWLCCRENYRDFVTNIWYKTNLSGGIPLTGITKNGTFKLINASEQVKVKPKYRFSNRPATNPNDIQISGKPEVVNDSGVVNSMVQNKVNRVYDMINGGYSEIKFNKSSVMSLTSDLDSFDVDRKDGYDYYLNDNVHPEYWSSYLHNISSLVNMSTARIVVSYIGKYIEDMHVLDLVEYLEGSEDNLNVAEGLYSGKYLIYKIVRTIGENNNFQTHLVLSRESFNELVDFTREVSEVGFDIPEDNNYTKAINKINSVMEKIRTLLSNLNFKLNIPNIRILAQELEDLASTLFGYDENGIWIKLEHILTSMEDNLIFDILQTLFNYLSERGETVYLDSNSEILASLNSGDFDDFIDSGYLHIPNIGSTQTNSVDYTSSTFSWYIQGKLTDDVQTGNTSLNNLLKDTLGYIKNGAVINQEDSSVFRRFWGYSKDNNINEDELKQMYSEEDVRRYLHKVLVPNGYVYVAHPSYLDIGSIKIDGKSYKIYNSDEEVLDRNSFTISYKSIRIDGVYVEYTIYRSNIQLLNKIVLEII